jgi:Spy/CpxP family protein refolding chaperone
MKTNWMRALVALTLMLAMSASLAVAAPKKGKGGPAAKAIDLLHRAAEQVDLTNEQKTNIKTIVVDAVAQAQVIVDEARATGGKPDRQALKAKITELVKETRAKIDGLLSDEQKTAFAAALADERAKAKAAREVNGDKPKKDEPAP